MDHDVFPGGSFTSLTTFFAYLVYIFSLHYSNSVRKEGVLEFSLYSKVVNTSCAPYTRKELCERHWFHRDKKNIARPLMKFLGWQEEQCYSFPWNGWVHRATKKNTGGKGSYSKETQRNALIRESSGKDLGSCIMCIEMSLNILWDRSWLQVQHWCCSLHASKHSTQHWCCSLHVQLASDRAVENRKVCINILRQIIV